MAVGAAIDPFGTGFFWSSEVLIPALVCARRCAVVCEHEADCCPDGSVPDNSGNRFALRPQMATRPEENLPMDNMPRAARHIKHRPACSSGPCDPGLGGNAAEAVAASNAERPAAVNVSRLSRISLHPGQE